MVNLQTAEGLANEEKLEHTVRERLMLESRGQSSGESAGRAANLPANLAVATTQETLDAGVRLAAADPRQPAEIHAPGPASN